MFDRNVIDRLKHYATALGFLLVVAAAYQLILTPFLTPRQVATVPVKTENVMVPADSLSDIFPEDAWQRGVCKRLQTTGGTFMLLFQNWEQTDDDRWKLWPITVVIGRSADGKALARAGDLGSRIGRRNTFHRIT